MTAKQPLCRGEARHRICRGVDARAKAVKVALGPRGRVAILDRDYGPPQIVNSGVVVAKAMRMENRFENMGAQWLLELASPTSVSANDDRSNGARTAIKEGIVPGSGVALLHARRVLEDLHGLNLDHDSGTRLIAQAVEEPLPCIAGLVLTTDCIIAKAPAPKPAHELGLAGPGMPEV